MGAVEVSNKIELICIGCPLGCNLTVDMDGSEVVEVKGNTCKKGKEYAVKEVTNPTRIVSVKTKEDIPKAKIHDCIKALKDVEVEAPIKIGDVLVSNIAGTGVDIVATRNIRKKQ